MRQEDQKFKIMINYIGILMPFWDIRDPVFKEEEEKKCIVYIRLVNILYVRTF